MKKGLLVLFLFMHFASVLYSQAIVRSYDSLGRMTQEIYPDSSSITYIYDNMGNLTGRNVHDPCSTKPIPVITESGPLTICAGDSVFLSTSPGIRYQWSTGDTTQTIKVIAAGSYSVVRTDTFSVYSDTLQCPLTSNPVAVTLKPLPNVLPIANQSVCNGDTTNTVAFGSTMTGTTYTWTNDNPGIGFADTFGTANIPSFTAIDSTHSPITASFAVIPTADGCAGPVLTFSITANPIPFILPPPNRIVCSDDSLRINFFTTIVGTTFNWVNADTTIGLADTGTGNIRQFRAFNSGSLLLTSMVWVTPSINGCIGTTDSFTISVKPLPTLSSSLTPPAICDSAMFRYTPISTLPGTDIMWTRVAIPGCPAAIGIDSVHERLINTTPYPIIVTYVHTLINSGCTDTQNVNVIVNPSPKLSSPLSLMPICDSVVFIYSPTTLTPGTSYTWNRSVVSGISNPDSSGYDAINESLFNTTSSPIAVFYAEALSANSCVNVQYITVTVNPVPILATTQDNVSCRFGHDGSITASVSTGTPPYTFAIDSSTFGSSSVFTNLYAGSYIIHAKDVLGCTCSGSATLTQPATVLSSSITATTNISCHGGNTGSISVAATGGTSPYSFSDDSITFHPTGTFTTLTARIYVITAKDSLSCKVNDTVILIQPSALRDTVLSAVNIICYGYNTGSIQVHGVSGTPPYRYYHDAVTTLDTIGLYNSLFAGSHHIHVIDAHGCSRIDTVTLTQPPPIHDSIELVHPVSCYGGNDGIVRAITSGVVGVPPFSYTHDSGMFDTSGLFTGLTGGPHTATVIDSIGCAITNGFSMPQPIHALTDTILNVTNEYCNGGNTGGIDVLGKGGTEPFRYSIDSVTFSDTGYLGNLVSGTYFIYLIDTNSCVHTDTATVTQPPAISITTNVTNEVCYDGHTGKIMVSATGGTGTLKYSLNSRGIYQVTPVFSSLPEGSDTVLVKDALNCIGVVYASITQPDSIIGIITNQTPDECKPTATGSVIIAATGGSGEYIYSIDAGNTFQPSSVFASLDSGSYTISIKDSNGCTGSLQFNILKTAPLNGLAITRINDTIYSPYAENNDWYMSGDPNSISTGSLHFCTQTGKYYVTGVDSNGCPVTSDTIVISKLFEDHNLGLTVIPNPTINNSTTITCQYGGEKKVVIKLLNSVGQVVETIMPTDPQTGNYSITINTTNLPNGAYEVVANLDGTKLGTKKLIINNR